MIDPNKNIIERVARAWASMDGKNFDDPDAGHDDGYMSDAEELLHRSGLIATAADAAQLKAERDALIHDLTEYRRMLEGLLDEVDTLLADRAAQAAAEPVCVRHSFDGYGYQYADAANGSDWYDVAMTLPDAEPLFEAPDARRKLNRAEDET